MSANVNQNILKKPLTWFLIFGVLILLAMDFWTWDEPVVLGYLGIPTWVYRFMGLQLLFALAMWGFIKHIWIEKPDDRDPPDQSDGE